MDKLEVALDSSSEEEECEKNLPQTEEQKLCTENMPHIACDQRDGYKAKLEFSCGT